MEIYIIAHNGPRGGRYIDNAATSEDEAREIAEQVTDNFLLMGYPAPTVERIPYADRIAAERAGEPVVTVVYHLTKGAAQTEGPEWLNVEIYRVRK